MSRLLFCGFEKENSKSDYQPLFTLAIFSLCALSLTPAFEIEGPQVRERPKSSSIIKIRKFTSASSKHTDAGTVKFRNKSPSQTLSSNTRRKALTGL
ncbi:hypothetical protein AVEN_125352-1 [Araneus ventricosus]|uniref:Uncharacterized protein n=1 Tax=Araneus ventricosus TaxID=182803 RepID=A0A4Y2SJ25_ARAVE|nr:hypothetical protein AVEN_125352-1 [Araneus ventricosus]